MFVLKALTVESRNVPEAVNFLKCRRIEHGPAEGCHRLGASPSVASRGASNGFIRSAAVAILYVLIARITIWQAGRLKPGSVVVISGG